MKQNEFKFANFLENRKIFLPTMFARGVGRNGSLWGITVGGKLIGSCLWQPPHMKRRIPFNDIFKLVVKGMIWNSAATKKVCARVCACACVLCVWFVLFGFPSFDSFFVKTAIENFAHP
jgi:hypothetical protein